MLKRITIMLDDDILKRLRDKQAKMLKSTNGSVSLSKVINELLQDNIKKKR